MKVLSLFDGMACGMLAMMEAGFEVERYVAYEIDKYAVQTSSHNFPMIEHRGDVFVADFTEFYGFDFLVGGSPCTYWSIAQKNNRETEASGMGWELFSQYVRALHEAKPKWFIYENNKSMSKAIRASIDEAFGFEAVGINSALVSAQNRQRLYWVGKRNEDGTYSKVDIEQPEDRGILLRDVLDNAVAWQDKAFAYTTRCHAATVEDTRKKHRHTMVAEPACVAERGRYEDGVVVQRYEAREDGKTNVLTTVQKDNNVAEPVQVGALPRPNGELSTYQSFRVYDTNAKSVTINANGGGAGGKTGLYAIPTDKPVYEVKDGMITIKGKQYPIKLVDGSYIIRKLTVTECMRLQTVPEWDEWPVSNSQAYKMLGNGWTVDVIAHLLRACKGD